MLPYAAAYISFLVFISLTFRSASSRRTAAQEMGDENWVTPLYVNGARLQKRRLPNATANWHHNNLGSTGKSLAAVTQLKPTNSEVMHAHVTRFSDEVSSVPLALFAILLRNA